MGITCGSVCGTPFFNEIEKNKGRGKLILKHTFGTMVIRRFDGHPKPFHHVVDKGVLVFIKTNTSCIENYYDQGNGDRYKGPGTGGIQYLSVHVMTTRL
jgi:hypothetical protein